MFQGLQRWLACESLVDEAKKIRKHWSRLSPKLKKCRQKYAYLYKIHPKVKEAENWR